jgi:anti-sigma factor RsiW
VRPTCREEIALLPEYVAGALGPVGRLRFAVHLARCAACRAYLRTYRATVALAARAADVEMPEEARRRVHARLTERLRERE